MRVALDARQLTQTDSGIGNYTLNLVRALLVSPANSRAIAEALVTLDQDNALREKLIAEGHTQLERFSWSNCAKATLAMYRELV